LFCITSGPDDVKHKVLLWGVLSKEKGISLEQERKKRKKEGGKSSRGKIFKS